MAFDPVGWHGRRPPPVDGLGAASVGLDFLVSVPEDSMKFRSAVILCAVAASTALSALPSAARADRVTDRIDKARNLYEKGRYSAAARELQWAIGRIKRRIADGVAKTFPAPPEGWTVRRSKSRSRQGLAMLQGLIIQRRYRQTGGAGRADAQIIVDNPMAGMMTMLFANPAYAQNAGYEQLDVDSLPQGALIKFDEERKRGDVVAMVGGRAFLKITIHNADSDKVLRTLIRTWNIAALKKQLGLP
jgi:hypothetical protein